MRLLHPHAPRVLAPLPPRGGGAGGEGAVEHATGGVSQPAPPLPNPLPRGEREQERPLRRHQLALLTSDGWQRVLAGCWDDAARDCLAHWAGHGLPLVVTRQRPQGDDSVSLGLPAPGRWQRRRIALAVPHGDIAQLDAFPSACRLSPLLPAPQRQPWRALCGGLSALGTPAHVYGSHGWQLLTGLDHVREGSDIDLHIAVDGPAQADAVAVLLQSWSDGLRLDGELMFPCGSAVAWREWLAWRAQRTPSVLVKRLDGVALAHAPFWSMAEAA